MAHCSALQRVCARASPSLVLAAPLLRRGHSRYQPFRRAFSDDHGNLGYLQPRVEVSSDDTAWALQRVSPESFQNRGLYADPATIFSSAVLLIILLGLSFRRILGLDRIIDQALRDWKEREQEKERRQVMDARQALEQSWTDDGPAGGPKP